jgi:hypothetical protein
MAASKITPVFTVSTHDSVKVRGVHTTTEPETEPETPEGLPDSVDTSKILSSQTPTSQVKAAQVIKDDNQSTKNERRASRSISIIGKIEIPKIDSKLYQSLESYGTAAFSIADSITDIFMTRKFFQTDRTSFAVATLVCIGMNLLGQSVLAYLQNKKRPWKVQCQEVR